MESQETHILLTTTLINTQREIALPLFLLLEYPQDFKELEILGKGGAGTIYRGELFDSALKQKHEVKYVAIKFIQGCLFFFFFFFLWLSS